MIEAGKAQPVVSDEEIADFFHGANFGHTNYRELLQASVLKKAMGYHCGFTITCIMVRMKLIGKTHGRPIKRGRLLLREAYGHLTLRSG